MTPIVQYPEERRMTGHAPEAVPTNEAPEVTDYMEPANDVEEEYLS